MANGTVNLPRFEHRSIGEYIGIIVVLALVVSSIAATAPQFDALGRGITRHFAPCWRRCSRRISAGSTVSR
jgi:hypothetical protein